MKNEYKVNSDRYGHVHKFVSINGNGNPYTFVTEKDWMPVRVVFSHKDDGDNAVEFIDPEGGPCIGSGFRTGEVEVKGINYTFCGDIEIELEEI